MRATATSDYGAGEIIVALVVAVAVQVGTLAAVYFGQKNLVADLPEIDKGPELPVKVQPVLDLEGLTLKLGGKKPVLPDMWQAPKPVAARPAQAAANDQPTISTTKDDKEKDPDKKKPKPDAGIDVPDAGDTEVADAAPPDETTDAAPTTDTTPEGHKDEGSDAGIANGDTPDPALASQKRTYAARIASFLAGFGRSHCGGAKGTVSGVVTLSGQTVTAVSMSPGDNADVNANVIPALQGAVGQSIPPPPEDHPEFLLPSYPVTIVCK